VVIVYHRLFVLQIHGDSFTGIIDGWHRARRAVAVMRTAASSTATAAAQCGLGLAAVGARGRSGQAGAAARGGKSGLQPACWSGGVPRRRRHPRGQLVVGRHVGAIYFYFFWFWERIITAGF